MWLESIVQDLRIGLRVLFKERSFCLLAASVLALGICAVATQYSVVNAVLLRPFPFRGGDRLVDVLLVSPTDFSPSNFDARATSADFADLRDQQTSFDAFVAYLNSSTVNLTYQSEPVRLQGGYVTHDFFRALGVSPALGRDFLPEEDGPGAEKAVLLSDALWHRLFNGDPEVINRSVRVNGRPGRIVGVMPPRFTFPTNEELWIPLHAEFPLRPRHDRDTHLISILGRLKPGVSLEQAEAELTTLAKQFALAYPDTNQPFTRGYVRPLILAFSGGPVPALLYTMLGFCIGVLLIACVNVMNMQFARATLRAKELAIRSSLGATRTRLLRQMLTESLVLASIGALAGVGLALWSTDFLNDTVRHLPNPPPGWMTFDLDLSVLLAVVAATVLSAIVSGLVPAWVASRANAIEVLKEGGRGNTSRAVALFTRGLVTVQVLVTSILLIGALLQLQSILRLQEIDYGYDTGGVLTARLGLMEGDYPTSADREGFYVRLLRELQESPQFSGAALTNRFRMVFSGDTPIEIEGRSYPTQQDRPTVEFENITPGYFDALGVRLIEGRDLTERDSDQREPVAVVNARFAQTYFPGASPLGQRLRTTLPDGTAAGPWRTIVGVVSDVRMQEPFDTRSDGAGFYVPFFSPANGPAAAEAVAPQFSTIVVRPRPGQRAEGLIPTLQAAVGRVDPNLPLYFVSTPRVAQDSFLAQNRLLAAMFGVFGGVALLLASVGLYGVTSFTVNQRTQEFGVRMALGADPNQILRLVLTQGAFQLLLGLALGLGLSLVVALVAAEQIQGALFGIRAHDPFTYAFVALLLAIVSLAATFIPARRATRVDPMIALRAE